MQSQCFLQTNNHKNTLLPNSIAQQIIHMKRRLDMVKQNNNGEQRCRK